MAATDSYALTKLEDFRGRVQVLMVLTAINVAGEPRANPVTPQQNRRAAYAKEVLNGPDHYLTRFLYAVTADSTITKDSSDATIQNRISACFDALAGVV